MKQKLKQLKQIFGITIKQPELWEQALTHSSYSNEHPNIANNERLEYLGDAVLELIVSDYLYHQYPDEQEGLLTKYRSAVVKGTYLTKIAEQLEIAPLIRMAKGETRSGQAKDSVLADVFEALIGAMYLDCGVKKVNKFIIKTLLPGLVNIIAEGSYLDPKSALQEWAQEYRKCTPTYKILKAKGPDHGKTYTTVAKLGKEIAGQGKGSSKQKAEVAAAADALRKLCEDNKKY